MQDKLSIINQFESNLKKCLLEMFGAYLPENKVTLLNATNFTTKELIDNPNSVDIQTIITRRVVGSVVGVNDMQRQITANDGTTIYYNFGQNFRTILIEYYTKKLSEKYKFDVSLVKGIENDLDTLALLYAKLDGRFDEIVFRENAMKLLEADELKELVRKYDTEELKRYFDKNAKIAEEKTTQQESDMLIDLSERKNSIQLIVIDGKEQLKYVDENGNVEVFELGNNAERIKDYYNRKLASLGPNEKLNANEVYRAVKEMINATDLREDDELDKGKLNHEEIDMLNFVNANKEVLEAKQTSTVTHSPDSKFHVLENSDDIVVVNKDSSGNLEMEKLKDGKAEELSKMNPEYTAPSLLTKDEYYELCDKYISGQELTEEEMIALSRADQVYASEESIFNRRSKNPVLSPYKNQNYYTGFTNQFMTMYIVTLAVFLLLIITIAILALAK